MSPMTRVFVARLAALTVFDPLGDPVGRVRDVVVHFSSGRPAPRVIGLVVEVPGRRRVFVPMTRVTSVDAGQVITSVDAGQVITTGLVNMHRFDQRTSETLVLAELFERTIRVITPDETFEATVEDVAIEQESNRDWFIVKVFARKGSGGSRSISRLGRRRGETVLVDIDQVTGLQLEAEGQSAAKLLQSYEDLKPADLAEVIHDLNPKRRAEVAAALDDELLADVLEELPEDDQVEILRGLGGERAADILEAMQPDDAADLLSELSPENAEELLRLMEPDEAADLRRLLTYDEDTAGGLMTTEPVILG
ncbi:MAG: magnesium transporter MgtE N-terminal domain-containing protein, partial [Dermatophilaceae bacterium]